MTKRKPTVVITSGHYWSYFLWFILGFYELENNSEIEFRMKLTPLSNMLRLCNIDSVNRFFGKLQQQVEADSYNMDGYILYPDGSKKTFSVDCADSPFLFDSQRLKSVDCYFKIQCPKDLESNGFALTDEIDIPWCDHAHLNPALKLGEHGERRIYQDFRNDAYKVKPLMLGPRQLAKGLRYSDLLRGYLSYSADKLTVKSKGSMCYFGNSMGPEPNNVEGVPDYNVDGDIMGFYGDKISHPNEKRAEVSEYVAQVSDNNDCRVIHQGHSNIKDKKTSDKVVPLSDFCRHISQFQYNFNVSGYRLSIPNRFIESFMVGTAIVTDELSVKWYKPFDPSEVVETVPMGYYPMNKVDWTRFDNDVRTLPQSNPNNILKCFDEKWSPVTVARYIIQTVEKS